MKKVLGICCSLTLIFFLAACGATVSSASANETSLEEMTEVTDSLEDVKEVVSTEEITTLEDLYTSGANADDLQSEVEELKTNYSDIYSNIEVKIEGNSIFYIYTYLSEVPENTDFTAIKASLEETLLPEAEALHEQVGSDDNITFISEFHNPDGTLLFSVSVEG